MSTSDTQNTMNDYLEALVQGGDFGSFFADDVVWTTMETGDEIRGRDQVVGFIAGLHSQMFDASPELVNLVCGDGVAMIEAVFAARHIGDFAGIEPTGIEVRIPYSISYDIAGGKIAALRAYFPILALRQALSEAVRASV
jgi:ketosteroid isomerase-like protein